MSDEEQPQSFAYETVTSGGRVMYQEHRYCGRCLHEGRGLVQMYLCTPEEREIVPPGKYDVAEERKK